MGKAKVITKKVRFEREIKFYEKKCAKCGNTFYGIATAKFCSRACGNALDYEKHAESRRAKRMEKYRREKRVSL